MEIEKNHENHKIHKSLLNISYLDYHKLMNLNSHYIDYIDKFLFSRNLAIIPFLINILPMQ